uniref:Endonuclease/exonuclease/phosphatase domain-containing protein n=1 Tax=Zooxanthella nutricula TaxID=1333877 RepID=A0A7S2LL35_9DINO
MSQKPRRPFVCGNNTMSAICAARPDADKYVVTASPRIGDEQYVFMSRKGAVEVDHAGAVYPDGAGIHARPPYAARFRIRSSFWRRWRLTVGTVHTSPKAAKKEIANLPKVLAWMDATFGGGSRLIAGDYNADGSYFSESSWANSNLGAAFKGYSLLTDNELDTTVAGSSNTYDRIIADSALARSAGDSQVFRLDSIDLSAVRVEGCRMGYVNKRLCSKSFARMKWEDYTDKAKRELAAEISDHNPVGVCLRG